MDAGDTFRLADSQIDDHLWIILSDPNLHPGDVLIVSITTWHEAVRDASCIIEPSEYSDIRVKSCVFFDDTRLVNRAHLRNLVQDGDIIAHKPIGTHLLHRIRRAAADSDYLTFAQLRAIEDQEWFPDQQ